ncbi:MAG: AAA family ATPase [Bacteroidales bacterium]|nr:AAA family ATPase [Bacteroidales bacterium]
MSSIPSYPPTQDERLAQERANSNMFTVKQANDVLKEAMLRPDPDNLYKGLWYEGEVCCLFADSNLGKSILAVQMANDIAEKRQVLYFDCELSDKQFQLRYTDEATGRPFSFSENLYRAEVNPFMSAPGAFKKDPLDHIEELASRFGNPVLIIDNLSYLCNDSDKGDEAGLLMMKLMNLKKKYGWSVMVIAHTPKRNLSRPITQNDLAGSKKLYNFFDSVFAIGKAATAENLRYVKQLKTRSGEVRFGSSSVIVCELVKREGFLYFEFMGFERESKFLRVDPSHEADLQSVKDLRSVGKSIRDIADKLDMSKSTIQRLCTELDARKDEILHSGNALSASEEVSLFDFF